VATPYQSVRRKVVFSLLLTAKATLASAVRPGVPAKTRFSTSSDSAPAIMMFVVPGPDAKWKTVAEPRPRMMMEEARF
jgi:hypothetical protein